MRHDEGRRAAEYLPKLFFPVHEHPAGAAAHEELDARARRGVEPTDVVQIVVRGTEEEGIVHVAPTLGQGISLGKQTERGGLRHNVRHIEHGGDAPSGSSPRLALHGGLVRKARVAHVDMLVDDAGKQKTSHSIESFCIRRGRRLPASRHFADAPVGNAYACLEAFSFVHYCDAMDDIAVLGHRHKTLRRFFKSAAKVRKKVKR